MKWDKIKKRIDEIISAKTNQSVAKSKKEELTTDIETNIQLVKDIIGISDDVVIRRFKIGNKLGVKAAIVFIDGLVDKQTINESILQPLLSEEFSGEDVKSLSTNDMVQFIEDNTMTINELKVVDTLNEVIKGPFDGDTALLIDGYNKGMILNSKGWEKRSIEEPMSESVIRGPRDGFTETLRVNTALLRRRVKHPSLRIKNFTVGNISQTTVAICYIEGIANKYLVEEVIERVQNINIDSIQESGYIEQLIEDNHFSLFPQILNTERPDKVASNLMEGRISIITDGTPFVLIMPITMIGLIQSPEDYYERFIISSIIRVLRALAMIISLSLPSIYIALISFHPEMLPTQLALAFAGGRSQVPFPSYVEAFMMETISELLREASVRLPTIIGTTIGILGTLVIGEAAVNANIVSPFMVIIVAITTIASFVVPNYSSAIAFRILKFPLIIITTIFGFYGMMLGIIAISIHLCSLKSFGIPYLTPLVSSRLADLKDAFIRAPFWLMYKRPQFMRTKNEKRFSSQEDDDQNERTR